jgi:maltose-binding protein MalE
MLLRLLILLLAVAVPASAATRVNVAIGADVNVVEVHKTILAPGFIQTSRDTEFNVVGTGTGEPASRAIYTKLKAQADAGRKPWDIDVALVSMAVASQMVKEGLLHRYVPEMKNAALVKGAEVKEAFGVNVDGYVVPMFHNQIAIAYNPAKVAAPPKSFDDLVAWTKANPGKFGYNGIKGGVSGVGFTMGWVYWKTGQY